MIWPGDEPGHTPGGRLWSGVGREVGLFNAGYSIGLLR